MHNPFTSSICTLYSNLGHSWTPQRYSRSTTIVHTMPSFTYMSCTSTLDQTARAPFCKQTILTLLSLGNSPQFCTSKFWQSFTFELHELWSRMIYSDSAMIPVLRGLSHMLDYAEFRLYSRSFAGAPHPVCFLSGFVFPTLKLPRNPHSPFIGLPGIMSSACDIDWLSKAHDFRVHISLVPAALC